MAKNIAETVRRQLGGRYLLFGEYMYLRSKLNIDAGKHVLAAFLN